MCGFFGILNIDSSRPFDLLKFATALQSLAHRGPDAQLFRAIENDAILGHRRLSIIDLSVDSNQPMHLLNRYWIIYNGEIFNYLELRMELESLGAEFRTSGDVEVLLYAYIYWGEACVSRFNGMWSFAIYDMQEKTLFCSRDRFGEKPFNYSVFDGRFFFASEIKAIIAYEPRLKRPNFNVISNFCRSSVGAQHAETWFEDILRLPPGCNLTIRNNKLHIQRYWNYPEGIDRTLSFDEARERYRDLFIDAVRVRMRSDVPLGLTLSAGLDSNSIAYAMQKIDPIPHFCFTSSFRDGEKPVRDSAIFVDSDEVTDEANSARRVAQELKLKSEIVHTDYSSFVPELRRIIYHLESGNSAPAVVPLMQLHRQARTHLKVVLEGQGADELLCGYVGALVWQSAFDLIREGEFSKAYKALRGFSRTYKLWFSFMLLLRSASNSWPLLSKLHQRLNRIDRIFGPKLSQYKHMPDYPAIADEGHLSGVARELRRQHSGGLVNLLHYGDAISMANSIESRMPFLDHRLVEFVWSLPSDYKIKLGIGKHIHREAMRGLVPDWIIDNPIKYGFCTPVNEQFRSVTRGNADPVEILLSDRCIQRGLFDKHGLTSLVEMHRSGKRDHGPLLFRLLCTEMWFRCFIDGEAV